MKIPWLMKENLSENTSSLLCLKMALSYYGRSLNTKELNTLSYSIGYNHYILPWGIMLSASYFNLYSVFISDNPESLSKSAAERIAATNGIEYEKLRELSFSLTEAVRKDPKIRTFKYSPDINYEILIRGVLRDSCGVIIPSIREEMSSRSIVITDIRGIIFTYHDPVDGPYKHISIRKFNNLWNAESITHNNLLIIYEKAPDGHLFDPLVQTESIYE